MLLTNYVTSAAHNFRNGQVNRSMIIHLVLITPFRGWKANEYVIIIKKHLLNVKSPFEILGVFAARAHRERGRK